MANSPRQFIFLLLLAVAATSAAARPCKTLFFITTTTYYPNFNSRNPNSPNFFHIQNPNSPNFFQIQNPSDLTLIFTNLNDDSSSSSSSSVSKSSDFPVNLYSSVSSSIRDRTMDIMSVVGALLFGVGCGAITAAVLYFVWALFSPRSFDFDDVSSSDSSSDDDDEGDDEVTAIKKKLGYVAIPINAKEVDGDDLKKGGAEEVV